MSESVTFTMEKVRRFLEETGGQNLAPSLITLVYPKGKEPCPHGSYFFLSNTTVTVLTEPELGKDIVWPP